MANSLVKSLSEAEQYVNTINPKLSCKVATTANITLSGTQTIDGISISENERVLVKDQSTGSENGIYISLDDGRNWQPFQLNLPTVPITDLTIRNNDLVASTQGRSFWILDDLTPLHQYSNRIKKSKMHFFNPRPSYRVSGSSSPSKTIGQNPPNGAVFHFYLKDKLNDKDKFSLEILYKNKIIRTISNKKGDKAKVFDGSYQTKTINPKKGMNKFVWDLKNDDLDYFFSH